MKKYIIGFILGTIIFSTLTAFAVANYNASQINYKNTTLDHAIDELYTTQNNTVTSLNSQITGLNTQLNKYKGVNWSLWVDNDRVGNNYAYLYVGDEIKSLYKYFTINDVTSSRNNLTCNIGGYANNAQTSLSKNVKYETSSTVEIRLEGVSTQAAWGRCHINIYFSN